MVDSKIVLTQVQHAAEQELKAFLGAIAAMYSPEVVVKASELWMDRMESAEWKPEIPTERFVRSITIRTAADLTASMSTVDLCS